MVLANPDFVSGQNQTSQKTNNSNFNLSMSPDIEASSLNNKSDNYILSLGIETTNRSATGALNDNIGKTTRLFQALALEGIDQNETITTSFTITPGSNDTVNRDQDQNTSQFIATKIIEIESENITSATS